MRSLRTRVVLIFLLLILLAMQLTGWYVEHALEDYYLGNHSDNVERQAQLMASFLERYFRENAPMEYIVDHLSDYGRESGLDLLLLNRDAEVVAATTDLENLVGRRIVLPEIDRAFSGMETTRQIREKPDGADPVLSLAVPLREENRVSGVLYLNAPLSGVYQTLHDIRTILLGATVLALAGTGFVAFFLSGTITDPVVRITERAERMARGNFDQKLKVASGDEIGQLARVFNYMADRLQSTLSEMSEEKRRLEVVLANMADGIIALDPRGRVMLSNPRACEILGTSPEEVTERVLWEALPGLSLQGPIEETMETGEDLTLRFEVSEPHRVVRAHLATIPGREGGGSFPGIVLVLHDITQQERAEQRRKEFIADVSHELKTPLTTIKSYSETLLDGAMDDEEVSEKFLAVVLDEADRMNRMVHDLLDLSLIDSGRLKWEEDYFSLPELIDDACGKMAPRADQRDVSLGYRGDQDVSPIFGDRDRIEQVLVNLISNAIEYTPSEGQVRVYWRQTEGKVRVVVSDDGEGIPQDDLPWIFERFYRVDKARARSSGGTGLGLAIAKEIVESHGGDITARSEEGQGTEIEFCLPIERSPRKETDDG